VARSPRSAASKPRLTSSTLVSATRLIVSPTPGLRQRADPAGTCRTTGWISSPPRSARCSQMPNINRLQRDRRRKRGHEVRSANLSLGRGPPPCWGVRAPGRGSDPCRSGEGPGGHGGRCPGRDRGAGSDPTGAPSRRQPRRADRRSDLHRWCPGRRPGPGRRGGRAPRRRRRAACGARQSARSRCSSRCRWWVSASATRRARQRHRRR
jgi:hypothetical protein